jgi:hypothetical protein
MAGLHGLIHDRREGFLDPVQLHFVPHPYTESGQGLLGIIFPPVEASVDGVLDAAV